jgi:hypothetical protein
MNIKKYKVMLLSLILLSVVFFFGICIDKDIGVKGNDIIVEAAEEEPPAGFITVTGEGIIKVKPDFAVIYVNISTDGTAADEAQKENHWILNKMLKKMNNIGISRENIETVNYNIYPAFPEKTEGDSTGLSVFELENDLKIYIQDIDNIGSIIDSIISSGVNSIYRLEFGITNLEEVRNEAVGKAVNHAKEQGETIAKALGLEPLKPVSIKSISEIETPEGFSINTQGEEYMGNTAIFPPNIVIRGLVEVKYKY